MFQKNPIIPNNNMNKSMFNDNEPTRAIRNYLDSTNMKTNLEHPHPDNHSFNVKKNENNEFNNKFLLEQSKVINSGNKKYLKNRVHLFDGKSGYYV